MLDPNLLKIMCCPETHQDLHLAESSMIENLNKQIEVKTLKNRAGKFVDEKFEAGLLRADGKYLYPLRKQIPVMLIAEAIPLGHETAILPADNLI